jgi:hypothetical protein
MFYGFLRVSRDLEINRLKIRELFVRTHVRLIKPKGPLFNTQKIFCTFQFYSIWYQSQKP